MQMGAWLSAESIWLVASWVPTCYRLHVQTHKETWGRRVNERTRERGGATYGCETLLRTLPVGQTARDCSTMRNHE